MKKYVIAKFNSFDGENVLVVVEAENELEAIKLGIEGNADMGLYNSVEEALTYYANGDMFISEPLEIG